MPHTKIGRRAIAAGATALLAAGLLTAGAEPTVAGNCGGHCQQMKACGQLVRAKGLKDASARQAEYNKCMTDPHNYH
ncbi:MAG: hypothetical protein JO288_00840 [Hyphomicrobiales bacterium]|nr:hypothetical protein [Hyphomicrobiales bacterium]